MALIVALGTPPDEDPERPDLVYEGAEGELTVSTPRIPEPSVEIDGALDDGVWERAAILTGFTQYDPVEGIAASQRTEVLVFVGDDGVYFGIRAFDDSPGEIRATLAERDEFTRSDDYVRLVLDTFDDQRRAYVFTVNPLGVQHDGLWVEGGGGERRMGPPIDSNPDFIWESGGRLEAWGWSAEVRIPFKSLRFPDLPVQDWGLNVERRIQRNGYTSSWAPVSGNAANRLAQSGRLEGLRDLDAGLFMEINPVLTGRQVGELDDDDVFGRSDPEADFGLNATYGLTSNLTLDATYNPDFSQVEADAGQIAVNERFALFFPEKRPFFLEGTEIFSLPARLIYTRSVVNPVAGAKLTGKVGTLNLGYLGAVDEASGDDPDAVVNILRARKDVGGSSTVGALYTDRTRAGDDYNRVGGADARLVFGGRYTLSVLGAASFTADPDEAGGAETGSFFSAEFQRAGRELSFSASIEDVAPEFVAGSGFLRRIGDTQLEARAEYNWRGAPGDLVERWGPRMELRSFWDHDDFWAGRGLQEAQVELGGSVSFRNNMTIFANYQRSRFDVAASEYAGLFVEGGGAGPAEAWLPPESFDGLDGVNGFVWMNGWERVRGNLRFEWKETPIFFRTLDVPVEVADALGANVSLDVFATRSLKAEVGLRHESLYRKGDGSRYSSATIPRIRAQYQFSRAFFVRFVGEYASQERGALLDPASGRPLRYCPEDDDCDALEGSDDYDFHLEGLVTYEPSPGTVVYLGYTRDMLDTGPFRFHQVEPRADGLFAKVSYRFRF